MARKAGDTICKQDLFYYFRNNVYLTTSGHFSTATLKYVNDYLGPSRLLFSVDYPYETIEMGTGWWDNDAAEIKEALGGEKAYYDVGRENAKKLLKFGQYYQSEA